MRETRKLEVGELHTILGPVSLAPIQAGTYRPSAKAMGGKLKSCRSYQLLNTLAGS